LVSFLFESYVYIFFYHHKGTAFLIFSKCNAKVSGNALRAARGALPVRATGKGEKAAFLIEKVVEEVVFSRGEKSLCP
jgi:hypothetical protein